MKSYKWVYKAVIALAAIGALVSVMNFIHKYGWGSREYKMVVIESDSMEPTIMTGALLTVQYCSITDIEEGDIVMFYAPQLHGYNTHRVIERGPDYLVTQGDNTTAPDVGTVIDDALVGKVVHIWNGAGTFTGPFVQDGPRARYTLIIALFTVVAMLSLIWVGLVLLVAFRWTYVFVLVLLGKAYTSPFQKKLVQDLETVAALVNEPKPKSIIWQVRLYDTLRNFHRDMDGYDDFVAKMKKVSDNET